MGKELVTVDDIQPRRRLSANVASGGFDCLHDIPVKRVSEDEPFGGDSQPGETLPSSRLSRLAGHIVERLAAVI